MINLNLITIADKKELYRHYLILLTKDLILVLLLLATVSGMIFMICNNILMKNFISVSQNSITAKIGNTVITQKIREINKNLKTIEGVQKEYVNWVKILQDLNKLTPTEEIQYTNLEINGHKNFITLSGSAITREKFLELKKNLEESPRFAEINSPLSNLLSAKNMSFILEMKLKK